MADMITSGDVRLNWKPVKKASTVVNKGDMLSVIKKGRLEVTDIEETKKGKYIVSMKRSY